MLIYNNCVNRNSINQVRNWTTHNFVINFFRNFDIKSFVISIYNGRFLDQAHPHPNVFNDKSFPYFRTFLRLYLLPAHFSNLTSSLIGIRLQSDREGLKAYRKLEHQYDAKSSWILIKGRIIKIQHLLLAYMG